MPVLGPDTHNPAAQASAYKLVKLLREAYPDIGLLGEHDSPANAAQASLLQYLSCEINPALLMTAEDIVLAKEATSIKGTLQFIDYVNRLPSERLSVDDKKKIVAQIKVIASTYPRGVWDESQEHWSVNQFYNKATRRIDRMMTPPAEALNLVCTALFDKTRYCTAEGAWERDLDLRITTVYLHLLSLRNQTLAGYYEKCSAGLQHDVLYFLNGSYLDNLASKGGKPIEMLMDTESFLLGSLSAFVKEHIMTQRDDVSIFMMLQAWMDWAAKTEEDIENPMITWLRGIVASPDVACKAYLESRCEEFGLNPGDRLIAMYVAELQNIPVVLPHDGLLPLIASIMQIKELALPPANGVPQHADSIYHLIELRNKALVRFKTYLKNTYLKTYEASLRDLFIALTCVDSLYRYRDLTMSVGAEDGQFETRRGQLKSILRDYFTDYSLEKHISSKNFEQCRLSYVAAERAFLNQNNTGFIDNFFALMDGTKQTWDAAWARLKVLRADVDRPHPLVLSDDELRAWHRQSESISADGSAVVDMTPYAINRLLLHGLLSPVNKWSPLYCQYLTLVTAWLLRPPEVGEGLLTQLKKSYRPNLLINLEFIALANDLMCNNKPQQLLSWLVEKEKPWKLNLFVFCFKDEFHWLSRQERVRVLQAVDGRCGELIRGYNDLNDLFNLSLEQLDREHRAMIINALGGSLSGLIKDGDQLKGLFSLSLEQFDREYRATIINALEFGQLIKTGYELVGLFSLSIEQFDRAQRDHVLVAVKGRLGELTQGDNELLALCSLSLEQLNHEQRAMIFEILASKGCLGALITDVHIFKDGHDLKKLFSFSLEKFDVKQRGCIWELLKVHLGELIKNGYQLGALFDLSLDLLSMEQREFILNALNAHLDVLINDDRELRSILGLSLNKLNSVQRARIFNAVEGRLGTLITRSSEFKALFSLTLGQLDRFQRSRLFDAVRFRLSRLIKDSVGLKALFDLTYDQLDSLERAYILEALALDGRLGGLIKDISVFQYMFPLKAFFGVLSKELNASQRRPILVALESSLTSSNQLCYLFDYVLADINSEQRTHILNYLEGAFIILIKDGDMLNYLFSRSPSRLDAEQRTQVLNALDSKLGALINGKQLRCLFGLSLEQLTVGQRAQIFNALKGQFGRLINNGFLFKDLFSLSLEQLAVEQRTQIFNALEGQFDRLINNGFLFQDLFSLSLKQFNTAQRATIFNMLKGNLGGLIKNYKQLEGLFSLSLEQLDSEQRTAILNVLELGKLIENASQLHNLFGLSSEQIDAAQKIMILNALKGRWRLLSKEDSFGFLSMLSLDQLNYAHRVQIFKALALEACLESGIKYDWRFNDGDELVGLFSLSLQQFNMHARTEILNRLFGCFCQLIKNGYQLRALFDLSLELLSMKQREFILNALGAHLGVLINDDRELRSILGLSLDKLAVIKRKDILKALALKGRLGRLIKDACVFKDIYELIALLSLSLEQFDAKQRIQLWSALDGKLGQLIKNSYQLADLFYLSLEQLDSAQRTTIINGLELGRLRDEFYSLVPLFNLSIEQLTIAQRVCILNALGSDQLGWLFFEFSQEQRDVEQKAQIWSILEGKFGRLIDNSKQLCHLFSLSPRQLDIAQREQIFKAVEDRLGELITTDSDRDFLINLSPEQLDDQKKAQILIATKSTLGLTKNPHVFFKNQTTECRPEEPAVSAAFTTGVDITLI